MRNPGSRIALLLLIAALVLIACTMPEDPPPDIGADDSITEQCETFEDPPSCTEALSGCQESAEAQECEDALESCTGSSEATQCVDAIDDCTQESDPGTCLDSVRSCYSDPEPMECPFAQESPPAMTVLDEIGLTEGEHLRARGSFMPGPRCSGSDFMSPIRMSNVPPLIMQQDQISFVQETRGHLLSDGMTLVFVDKEKNYDEVYILQADKGGLAGLELSGTQGTLPSFGDIPRLDPMLTGVARDAIFGGPRDERALFDVLGAPRDSCAYSVMIDFR